ncbi:hypothetical protein DES53_101601 [Roseimicrobium gellanilyticum]|uniref:Peptidase M28 domain-containing protein n=1 Tax=Roseimicrobium gellanilyticum TaxID=748857 RepID=A0A366HU32_9BACT|nr:hypothetical protein [Roseimicrobium gellanilyticum]RBP47801.1 hypothetical protein DES53_101601 [Roseimicrobium gellanilyticum]
MSDTPPLESGEAPAKAGCVVRAFIIALPLGLAFMIPLSLWIYYQKKYAKEEAATSHLASMLQRELNSVDYVNNINTIDSAAGDASTSKTEVVAKFVESKMGFANMGYNIEQQSFDVDGKKASNLVVELPGKKDTRETVLVIAGYDTPDASGISALMCVAHAMTGTTHSRTIRFAAVTHSDAADTKANGIEVLAKKIAELEVPVKKVILFHPALKATPAAWQNAEITSLASELKDPTPTPLDMLQRLKKAVETAADE